MDTTHLQQNIFHQDFIEMWLWIAENSVELIGHILTLIAIIVSVKIVTWQLSKQHRDSLNLQRDNAREALKLDIYKSLTNRTKNLSRAITSAMVFASTILMKIKNHQEQVSNYSPIKPLSERAVHFFQMHNQTQASVSELLHELEIWEISFPGLKLFKDALISSSHDLRESFAPLYFALLDALPMDPPDDAPKEIPRPMIRPPLDNDKMERLKQFADKYASNSTDLSAYLIDLVTEGQNNLLSGLFGHTIQRRKTIDPDLKVISTEPECVAELMRYFNEETAWGKMKTRVETEQKRGQTK